MMKSINLKKYLGRLTFRREFRTISSKAHHDWRIMLVFFFLLWIATVLGSLYIFVQIDRGDIFVAENKQEENPVTISKKLLEDTVEVFEGRKIKLEQLETKRSSLSDPSL